MKHVRLPRSKSISNRLLLLQQTLGGFKIEHLSQADDTRLLNTCIKKVMQAEGKAELYVDNDGTACRFLTAWLSTMPGVWTLTGSKRMQERPIHPLVKVLLDLGADITYPEQDKHLPLHIAGKPWKWKSCCVDVALSSQFATALMLLLPLSETPVTIKICHKGASQQYIFQTIELMQQLGVNIRYDKGNILYQPSGEQQPHTMTVEADWSAAAFWYEYMAVHNTYHPLCLDGLCASVLQKDNIIAEWMQTFGVQTEYTKKGVILHRHYESLPEQVVYDVADNLDLVPMMMVTCAALNVSACFKGATNMQYKESNRIAALAHALQAVAKIEYQQGEIKMYPTNGQWPKRLDFDVHHDHRVAMALAMLPYVDSPSCVNDRECVAKSYPHFWSQWHNICMQK